MTLEEKVDAIQLTLNAHLAANEQILARLEETAHMHSRDIYGDGDKRAGLKMDVDRLKQTDAARSKITGAIGTGVVGLALNAIWNAFRGHS